MFSIDALIIKMIPLVVNAIVVNKFTLLSIYVFLSKMARKTETTIDDKILTMIKNIFMIIIGKGHIVKKKYEEYKNEISNIK